ncbi:MAG: BON domain-containing protein [Bacteriovorax sp.]|nr:BON domain-containing protein [Bacteriovorax sp.]
MEVSKNKFLIFILLFFSNLTFAIIKPVVTNHNEDITYQLRNAILSDSELSKSAHLIKITPVKNAIILEGHVASRAEKVKIENLARARAKKNKVYNRLTY